MYLGTDSDLKRKHSWINEEWSKLRQISNWNFQWKKFDPNKQDVIAIWPKSKSKQMRKAFLLLSQSDYEGPIIKPDFWFSVNSTLRLVGNSIKFRQSQNDFFKASFCPKNERSNLTLLLWYLRSTCFRSFFGGNRRPQKNISKLTDL